MKIVLLLLLSIVFIRITAQEDISFVTSDGLTVSAHLYEIYDDAPYILLFHQAGFSKGEYKTTAIKLLKLGYTCLAVDLRVGEGVNFIQNQTAKTAKEGNFSTNLIDSEKDILAAIDYAWNKTKKPVILFGSSFSASLVLKLAKNNPKVRAVIAFSPGEYFQPDLVIKDLLTEDYDKTVFVASSQREFSYMVDLMGNVSDNKKTLFKPQEANGEHGAKVLWKECNVSNEYWLALYLFFKSIDSTN